MPLRNGTLGGIDLGGFDAESDVKLASYFVTTPHVTAALSGRPTLFLGRKGSGKSAVFRELPRLYSEAGRALATILLTPDQYAWAALRQYREQGLLLEQAHTNAWKLTLAIEVAGALVAMDREWTVAAGNAVDNLQQFLRDNYGKPRPDLRTTTSLISNLTALNLGAFGFTMGVQRRQPGPAPLTPAVIDALLDAIAIPLEESGVVVLLDRLDDSWDGSAESSALLVGLLKAAKDLNDWFGLDASDHGLRVLTFLRSDIYDGLRFDDKDKHRPSEELIVWSPEELRRMLEMRLPQGVGPDDLFEEGEMRGSIQPLNYIMKRTFLRPREVLQFVDVCLRVAGRNAREVSKDQVRIAEERYSRWKVDDLKQEYRKVYPDFEVLLECLRQEIHRYDRLEDLEELFKRKQPEVAQRLGTRAVLEMLFEASVIGVRLGDAGSARFKSEDSELVLPASGAAYVHQSLYKGLNIRETRRAASDELDEE